MSKKNKRRVVFVNSAPTTTMATAAPIDMKDFPDIDKPIKRTAAKRVTPAMHKQKEEAEKKIAETAKEKLSKLETHPTGDSLEEWKRTVILACENIIDEAIETMVTA